MRKLPSSPSLQRSTDVISPKVQLIIACEGRNTEPDYISQCVKEYGAGLVRLHVIPETGAPITVVSAAIAERKAMLALYNDRKVDRSQRIPFKVWAIFDKDDYEVDAAIALAKENGIEIAFSNPCFELWPLLHLENYGAQDGRHALQRRLRHLMPNYDHDNAAIVDFELIKKFFDVAYQRAKQMNASRVREDCALGCPSTTVGELVLKIVQNGKYNFRSAYADLLGKR